MIPALSPESLGLTLRGFDYTGNDPMGTWLDKDTRILINAYGRDDDGFNHPENSLAILDEAIARVSIMRANLGAYQNRLENIVKNLDGNISNTAESLSRLRDTDMAFEMTEYTLRNVTMQAGIAMLAQANERPQQLLQLLR
jgi:flagellin